MTVVNQEDANHANARLTTGPVARRLAGMSIPMAWGILAIIAFAIADTYFVGQLGTTPLAALAFTFPLVMAVRSLALGMGIGTASVLARAIGSSSADEVRRLTTDSLVIATVLITALAVVGILTINPLFSLMGAGTQELPLIREYMLVWYLGMPFLVVPMIGNFAMRSAGEARLPSLLMIVAAFINAGLDPLLIFGWGPIAPLGIQGAALASLLSRLCTLAAALFILHYRMHMIAWTWPRFKHLWASGREIGKIAGPAAATNVINPLAVGVVTAIVASYGPTAVAGFGVATRIEALALIPILALTAGLGPLVGQNWGAGERQRVAEALQVSTKFCVIWGLCVAAVLALAAPQIVPLFDKQPETIAAACAYLWIVPISFTAYGVLICVNSALNAAGRPLIATTLMAARTFALYVPLAWLASRWFNLYMVFACGAFASFIAGGFAWRTGLRLTHTTTRA